MRYKIQPNNNCKYCYGTGEISDTVDYGSTTAQLKSLCDCVIYQLPDTFDDKVDEVMLDFSNINYFVDEDANFKGEEYE